MNIFLKDYNIKEVSVLFSVHALIVFTIFCLQFDEPITHFKDPIAYSGDFDTENAYRKPPVIL
jgi:hypothetical protein